MCEDYLYWWLYWHSDTTPHYVEVNAMWKNLHYAYLWQMISVPRLYVGIEQDHGEFDYVDSES